jgi:hypothetical protein
MLALGEVTGVLVLWLAFVSLVGYYVVRIALMLREQHIMERAYRLRLAVLRGKAVREGAAPAAVEDLGRQPVH